VSLFTINSKTNNPVLADSTWRRYGLWYLTAVLLLSLLVAAVNAVIDPQGRIMLVEKPGFNEVKLTFNNRQGKARALRQCDYDALILGTSRTETGIRVEQPALAERYAYNAALKAATMYEMRRLVAYALEHQNLKTVVIGLDLTSFNSKGSGLDDFYKSPLAESVSPNLMARYLVSLQTLKQSYYTLKWNRRKSAKTCEDRGEQIPRRNAIASPDVRTAFDFVLKRYASGQYYDYKVGAQHLRYFSEALDDLQQAGIEVVVFIAPMHATHVELLREMEMLDVFHDWKRQLVLIVAEVNAQDPEAQPIALWDFSGYNRLTTEYVPLPEESTTMRWYKDSAHFNQAAGDLLMNEMFGLSPAELGVRLTPTTIEGLIQAEGRASDLYRSQNPAEIARLQEMLLYAPYPMFNGF
jgi:hypothetical protein